jgi:hypothetical protein
MRSQYRSSREARMWRLLKTEFEYDRFVLGMCFSFVTIISFVFLILGGGDLEKSIPAYRAVLICSAAIVWFNSLVKLQKEKRECIQMKIPVGIRTIGLSRLLYLCIFWIIIAGLFFIINWIVKGHTLDLTDVTSTFSMTGILFMANAFTLLQKDLRYFYTGKHAKFLLSVLFFILICIAYFVFILSVMSFEARSSFGSLRMGMRSLFFSEWGAAGLMVLGIGFSFMDLWVFKNRIMYLE